MKRRIAKFLFVYGCAGSGLCLGFLVWLGWSQRVPAMHLNWFLGGFAVHACVLCATFQPYARSAYWSPVLRPTARSIRMARRTLFLAAALVAVLYLFPVVDRALGGEPTVARLVSLLAGLFLLSSVYVAVHWGLRPENLFSPIALRYLSNPLLEIGRLGYLSLRKWWKG
ncbi:MAG: hypothetical protein J0H49_12565 [Acidobacteria bacterium]|nr:hypothetical protein [Acidobacteriota bacterium]